MYTLNLLILYRYVNYVSIKLGGGGSKKLPMCPKTRNQSSKLWYVHTVLKFNLAIKKDIE